ncbi:MAG: hypothetical protein M1816_006612 [Peltula sp. TS41687]|nr:MAG: hypothetical protein M1816_006612 [Peltula sp. TS41687]
MSCQVRSMLPHTFKVSRDLSTTSRSVTIMENGFGCPSHLVDVFKPQTPSIKPQTTSTTQLEENIEHLIHRAVNTGLSGAPLDALTARFQEYLVEQIEDELRSKIGDDWIEFPDLNAFVEKYVFEAAVRSMFGTYILSLNPTLAEDFSKFNRFIGATFMGQPRWLKPAAYRAREKMLENIKRWQRYTREHCDIANGVPFRFIIEQDDIGRNIQADQGTVRKAHRSEREFEKIRFALVPRVTYAKAVYLNDEDDDIYETLSEGEFLLGLDHVDRSKSLASGRGDGIIIR